MKAGRIPTEAGETARSQQERALATLGYCEVEWSYLKGPLTSPTEEQALGRGRKLQRGSAMFEGLDPCHLIGLPAPALELPETASKSDEWKSKEEFLISTGLDNLLPEMRLCLKASK